VQPKLEQTQFKSSSLAGGTRFRLSAIGPLHGHGKAAARSVAQDQRVDATDAPLLENLKALTLERMERVSDLDRSRCSVSGLCNSD
jgi:hypothetical protein